MAAVAAESAADALALGASAAEGSRNNGGSGGGKTVVVSAELLDRIIKNVNILVEMVRREKERAERCRGCGGEADYLASYEWKYVAGRAREARICERCMEDTVSRKYGMDVYVWKNNLSKLTCLRCGDDVTDRGWCVCPRNAALARKGAAPRTTEGDAK